ncbi:terpenoid synthase [Trametes coccinea BRFM310]|uniref:Terpenoid synthase n=1 Tax=Trametes coccinea (strain BRFM310) TaxID=1353009 RepID=A0A1Y2J3N4_TRAC3|nr:terpenoid synthase [Trametes coccinea BRFM310]
MALTLSPTGLADNHGDLGPLFESDLTSAGFQTLSTNKHLAAEESSTNTGHMSALLRTAVQDCVTSFLGACTYTSPRSAPSQELRQWLSQQMSVWEINLSPKFLEKALNASCNYVETVYAHLPSPDHRRYVALYTACMFYAEDIGENDPDSVMEFTRRFIRGESQPDTVFDCLAKVLKRAYDFWPPFGADSIITGTLDALSANYIECTTQYLTVKPEATRYPNYLRLRAGIGAPYTHFLFAKSWRHSPESYLQILPEIDHWTLGANDILSFYKEELAGERTNYIHLRMAAEQTSAENVLRELVSEVSDTARRMKLVLSDDPELLELWNKYMQCYLEFHLKTPRYRLGELGFQA